MATASGVAIDLDPLPTAEALYGGEDHSLLAAFPAGVDIPPEFRPIGRVVAGAGVLVAGIPLESSGGWDPYREWDSAAG